jgi:hypothetical protein
MKLESLFESVAVDLLDYLLPDADGHGGYGCIVSKLSNVVTRVKRGWYSNGWQSYNYMQPKLYGEPFLVPSSQGIAGQMALLLVLDCHAVIDVVDEKQHELTVIKTEKLADIFEKMLARVEVLAHEYIQTSPSQQFPESTFKQILEDDEVFNDFIDAFFAEATRLINTTTLSYGMKYGKNTPASTKKLFKKYCIETHTAIAFAAANQSQEVSDEDYEE